MTQGQKEKLEQEVKAYTTPYIRNHGQHIGDIVRQDFISIYQTILENPEQWGLMPILDSMDHIEESDQNWSEVVNDLKSQLTKYREALDKIVEEYETIEHSIDDVARSMKNIAKEALKNNEG